MSGWVSLFVASSENTMPGACVGEWEAAEVVLLLAAIAKREVAFSRATIVCAECG